MSLQIGAFICMIMGRCIFVPKEQQALTKKHSRALPDNHDMQKTILTTTFDPDAKAYCKIDLGQLYRLLSYEGCSHDHSSNLRSEWLHQVYMNSPYIRHVEIAIGSIHPSSSKSSGEYHCNHQRNGMSNLTICAVWNLLLQTMQVLAPHVEELTVVDVDTAAVHQDTRLNNGTGSSSSSSPSSFLSSRFYEMMLPTVLWQCRAHGLRCLTLQPLPHHVGSMSKAILHALHDHPTLECLNIVAYSPCCQNATVRQRLQQELQQQQQLFPNLRIVLLDKHAATQLSNTI